MSSPFSISVLESFFWLKSGLECPISTFIFDMLDKVASICFCVLSELLGVTF